MTIIQVPKGTIKRLAKEFRYSRNTIAFALKGNKIGFSEKAKKIRAKALEMNGREMNETKISRDTKIRYKYTRYRNNEPEVATQER